MRYYSADGLYTCLAALLLFTSIHSLRELYSGERVDFNWWLTQYTLLIIGFIIVIIYDRHLRDQRYQNQQIRIGVQSAKEGGESHIFWNDYMPRRKELNRFELLEILYSITLAKEFDPDLLEAVNRLIDYQPWRWYQLHYGDLEELVVVIPHATWLRSMNMTEAEEAKQEAEDAEDDNIDLDPIT